jgi:hypothetical protein
MDLRRIGWLLLRAWAVLVLAGLAAVSALAVTGSGGLGPQLGIWVGVGGFIVVALGMLVLVQASRDSGP